MKGLTNLREVYQSFKKLLEYQSNIEFPVGSIVYKGDDPCIGRACSFETFLTSTPHVNGEELSLNFNFERENPIDYLLLEKVQHCLLHNFKFSFPGSIEYEVECNAEDLGPAQEFVRFLGDHSDELDNIVVKNKFRVIKQAKEPEKYSTEITDDNFTKFIMDKGVRQRYYLSNKAEEIMKKRGGGFYQDDELKYKGKDHKLLAELAELLLRLKGITYAGFTGEYSLREYSHGTWAQIVEQYLPPAEYIKKVIIKAPESKKQERPEFCGIKVWSENFQVIFSTHGENLEPSFDLIEDLYNLLG